MKSLRAFAFLLVLLALLFFGFSPFKHFQAADSQTSEFEKREAAYRANNLGAAWLDQYKTRDAVASFTRALEIQPDLLIARLNLAIALYYLPDAAGARREAEKALLQDPKAPHAHYILGLINRGQNNTDQAVAEFEKVLNVDPDDVATNINLGQLFTQQKKHAEARAAFNKALGAEPYNETALYNLGLLLIRTGAKQEGQRLMQKFQRLRESGAGTSLGTNYLEGGRYAEALVSTGAEAELVDKRTPKVRFVDATAEAFPLSATTRTGQPSETPGAMTSDQNIGRRSNECASKFFAGHDLIGSFRFGGAALVLLDFDGDGDLDLFDLRIDEQRLFRNDRGRFVTVTVGTGALGRALPRGTFNVKAIAGDYDNDGRVDLFILRNNQMVLYHNDGNGKFSERSLAGMPAFGTTWSIAFVDVDHDGDLDIFMAGGTDFSELIVAYMGLPPHAPLKPFALKKPTTLSNLLLRNNGNGTFADVTKQARVGGEGGEGVQVIPTDFDNRRDVDLLVVHNGSQPSLYQNMRDGSFRDVAQEVGLNLDGLFYAGAAGDVNKDGYTDFYFAARDSASQLALSDGRGRFHLQTGPPFSTSSKEPAPEAAQFIDYDNDGQLDLVTVSVCGEDTYLKIWRNVGDGWVDVSETAVGHGLIKTKSEAVLTLATMAAADTDGDGDTDLILRTASDDLIFLRNDGGNRNHSLRVNLRGLVSNKSAVEAKVEMRAGSLWQKLETYSAAPAPAPADVIFGLGKRSAPDAVRVIWPAGIVQAETEFPAGNFMSLNLTELDRKPSSCPYLYTWNGERFEFLTDFMGGAEMGYLEEPGRYNKPDPDEYVRIRDDQLKEKDGRYELRVTNELEEALFVDRLQLLVVAHPNNTAVYPNEGMTDPPKPFRLFFTEAARPPLSAHDDHGHDVLDLISRMDRRWPDDFERDQVRGYAAEHSLTMTLPGSAAILAAGVRENNAQGNDSSKGISREASAQDARGPRLFLTGWTDYAWSSDNVAAAQAGKTMELPALQVKDAAGKWRTIIKDIGIPVGRPQTVVVDLTGKFPSANREVRIVTSMRIYWDQILVDTAAGTSPYQLARLDPLNAELNWRGFSAEVAPDGREPFGYDYRRVSFTSPWKVMTGRYTREGSVRELLLKGDDMFVICRPGDEIALSFDARALPPLPEGWTRTFLLYADGFSKEMDINSASPDQVGPLPFHGMSRYPYKWPERYPLTEARRRYIEQYNTRFVSSTVSRIETVMQMR